MLLQIFTQFHRISSIWTNARKHNFCSKTTRKFFKVIKVGWGNPFIYLFIYFLYFKPNYNLEKKKKGERENFECSQPSFEFSEKFLSIFWAGFLLILKYMLGTEMIKWILSLLWGIYNSSGHLFQHVIT